MTTDLPPGRPPPPTGAAGTERPPRALDLETLIGIRSSRRTFYVEYRATAERLERSVRSLERVAHVLGSSDEDVRALTDAVVTALADHLDAHRVVLWVDPQRLPEATVRAGHWRRGGDVVLDGAGIADSEERRLRCTLQQLRTRDPACDPFAQGRLAVAPLAVDGRPIGVLGAWTREESALNDADRAVLHILGSQLAAALRRDDLLRRSDRLRHAAERQAEEIARRHRELTETRTRLTIAEQHATIEVERRRIARELHDAVAQHLLSAGMTIEWCRAEVEGDRELHERLSHAKGLTRTALQRLRASIAALTQESEDEEDLVGMLHRLARVHTTGELDVQVRVEGRPGALGPHHELALLRTASEAVFNAARHGAASRVILRLSFRGDTVRLSVADDGQGRPEQLRRSLASARGRKDGYQQGLPNIAGRAEDLGGEVRFQRARLGGVRILVDLPLPRDRAVTG